MLSRIERKRAMAILNLMKSDIAFLLESLINKDKEISNLELCDGAEEYMLTSVERRVHIEGLVYDIISGRDTQLLDDINRITENFFDISPAKEVA